MHPSSAFRKTGDDGNIEFARRRGFGILSVNADPAPLLSHIPFQLSQDGNRLEAHLIRSNSILRLLENPVPAVIAVSGDDSYISPDWYGVENQVPTWNYVAVHLRGTLTKLKDDALHGILVRLSATMEGRLLPKTPWKIDKMDNEVYAKMLKQIVPVAMEISEINGTWKLSQNKTEDVRLSAAKGLRESGHGAQFDLLPDLMEQAE